jgi:hypothetical protein
VCPEELPEQPGAGNKGTTWQPTCRCFNNIEFIHNLALPGPATHCYLLNFIFFEWNKGPDLPGIEKGELSAS